MYSTVAATKAHIVLDPFDISATGIQISSESEGVREKTNQAPPLITEYPTFSRPGKPDQIRDGVFASHLPCSTIELTTSVIDAKGGHILLLQICYMNLGFRLWPNHNACQLITRLGHVPAVSHGFSGSHLYFTREVYLLSRFS